MFPIEAWDVQQSPSPALPALSPPGAKAGFINWYCPKTDTPNIKRTQEISCLFIPFYFKINFKKNLVSIFMKRAHPTVAKYGNSHFFSIYINFPYNTLNYNKIQLLPQ
ncbi:hypothetical protein DN53_07455 [Flagellimonas olearia]|uniref:Uncharacterized protein n=1 Tax=Flagellimonas olearia TaxID=552546 RepID=A0A444VP96_9FLAO|nr:hypothetical protein DN53_07455 [Allomuricauda olearia]